MQRLCFSMFFGDFWHQGLEIIRCLGEQYFSPPSVVNIPLFLRLIALKGLLRSQRTIENWSFLFWLGDKPMKCFMIETSVGFYQRDFLVKAMYFIKGIVFLMNKQRGEMVVNGDRKVRCLRGIHFLVQFESS